MHGPTRLTGSQITAKSQRQHSIACNSNSEHNLLYRAILTGKQDDVDALRHHTAFWSRVLACTVNECCFLKLTPNNHLYISKIYQ